MISAARLMQPLPICPPQFVRSAAPMHPLPMPVRSSHGFVDHAGSIQEIMPLHFDPRGIVPTLPRP